MRPYYEQDGVTIFLGDCREILPQLELVDHVISDPPYARDVYVRLSMPNTKPGSETPGRMGVPVSWKNGSPVYDTYGTSGLSKLAAGDIGHMDDMRDDVAKLIVDRTKRWMVVFCDVESVHLWKDSLISAGSLYRRTGLWVKKDPMPQMSGDRPATGFEPCVIAHNGTSSRWNGGGKAGVWIHGTCKVDRPDHPCPKPEPLMCELVVDFTDPGETILDPFMGSGTTLVAAKRLGRRAIGIEINEEYAEIAAKRLQQGALPLEMGA